MSIKRGSLYFIAGADTYRSWLALKSIEGRFLSKQDSMSDFSVYDMEEVSLNIVKQTCLTNPFFVSHRLFVLKNCFSLSKSDQEDLIHFLPSAPDSTVIVIYESKACDRRLALYQWLVKSAKVEISDLLEGRELARWILNYIAKMKLTVAPDVLPTIAELGNDTSTLAQELKKIGLFVMSNNRTEITREDVLCLTSFRATPTIFEISNALREKNIKSAIRLMRQLLSSEDPMAIAGLLSNQVRVLTKLVLAKEENISLSQVATRSKLNPYVVKLSQPLAIKLNRDDCGTCYRHLLTFDQSVKNGTAGPEISLLMLIVRLHTLLHSKKFAN